MDLMWQKWEIATTTKDHLKPSKNFKRGKGEWDGTRQGLKEYLGYLENTQEKQVNIFYLAEQSANIFSRQWVN